MPDLGGSPIFLWRKTMLLPFLLKISRSVFKSTGAVGRIIGAIHRDNHPHTYRIYTCGITAAYLAHIYVNLRNGIELEHGLTAVTAGIELVAHLLGV